MLCPICLSVMFEISLQLADGEYRFGQCPHGHSDRWERDGQRVNIADVLGTLAAAAGGIAVPRRRRRATAHRGERTPRVATGCVRRAASDTSVPLRPLPR